VDPLLDASYWESSQPGQKPAPLVVHQLHDCEIFSMCLLSDSVLLTGGDDCIKAWKIDSLLPGPGREAPRPIHVLVPPQIEVGRGARLPVAETNGLAVNDSRSAFYSACGDGRAYCWDSSTFKLRAKLEGHTNYLHCVACQGDNAVATGSEDGTVRIWDARDPNEPEELVSSGPAPSGARPSWIGAVDIDESGQWVAAGGGGRCVGMWHLPSRKLVANMPTCGAVHALKFCGDKLVSGGAEPAIYLWSRSGVFFARDYSFVDCGTPRFGTQRKKGGNVPDRSGK
jgi:WD40 repeat protein